MIHCRHTPGCKMLSRLRGVAIKSDIIPVPGEWNVRLKRRPLLPVRLIHGLPFIATSLCLFLNKNIAPCFVFAAHIIFENPGPFSVILRTRLSRYYRQQYFTLQPWIAIPGTCMQRDFSRWDRKGKDLSLEGRPFISQTVQSDEQLVSPWNCSAEEVSLYNVAANLEEVA